MNADRKDELRNILAMTKVDNIGKQLGPAKLILIQSILLSLSAHVMRCFKLPLAIANKIDSVITRFWWASNGDRGIHWVNREMIQKPKGLGGLGIRSVSTLNDTMLFKQALRLHQNPKLLVSKVLFNTQGCFVCKERNALAAKQTLSWGRRGLANAVRLFDEGMAWKIGNGCNTKATSMAWVNGSIPQVKNNQ
ncbi:uncharacterized mitochondrial protein AtMg00310-like [Spinacia oleracea]|uniref:Uncharacterized mitochondrial protein AtMg00310-like n=1 Tax=Spinacia oleracea TaxID=3562 RepID=A0ABM3RH08_SPIOL|nr:uncharacterized mitochondrial protein AtMg00310-like [Spinacia oleracea]